MKGEIRLDHANQSIKVSPKDLREAQTAKQFLQGSRKDYLSPSFDGFQIIIMIRSHEVSVVSWITLGWLFAK